MTAESPLETATFCEILRDYIPFSAQQMTLIRVASGEKLTKDRTQLQSLNRSFDRCENRIGRPLEGYCMTNFCPPCWNVVDIQVSGSKSPPWLTACCSAGLMVTPRASLL